MPRYLWPKEVRQDVAVVPTPAPISVVPFIKIAAIASVVDHSTWNIQIEEWFHNNFLIWSLLKVVDPPGKKNGTKNKDYNCFIHFRTYQELFPQTSEPALSMLGPGLVDLPRGNTNHTRDFQVIRSNYWECL